MSALVMTEENWKSPKWVSRGNGPSHAAGNDSAAPRTASGSGQQAGEPHRRVRLTGRCWGWGGGAPCGPAAGGSTAGEPGL